jgi:precorrin-6B methylase 1
MSPGSLAVVGTGIKLVAHTTIEARQRIQNAEKLLYVGADPALDQWLSELNPAAESLNGLYRARKPRRQTYEEMVQAILAYVREGYQVCAVFYGHPGVFVYPSHRAIELARKEGFDAWMAPGISAEDCLFADLGIDPAIAGCQTYEATNFLVRRRCVDPYASLILWQIGVIGDRSVRRAGTYNKPGIDALIDVLSEMYGPKHSATVYRAAEWPICDPYIKSVTIEKLHKADITPLSTLYVPAKTGTPVDDEMVQRLKLRHRNGRA